MTTKQYLKNRKQFSVLAKELPILHYADLKSEYRTLQRYAKHSVLNNCA
jgi:hypothetical protein